jgi:hypothetical protein
MPLISSSEKVFVYADASLVGCGGMIAAGEVWKLRNWYCTVPVNLILRNQTILYMNRSC